ncbi:MarR family winged helix-turn-helix transcriptional regulator [Actinomadura atramentaria]|uniref:MarR family winged helix-turn-helix transcriptional regulator n=1 Tax=Actinomadura atramentaria TaxID=1990 RepID=UPI00036CBC71|nr:MarR family winged helix-turn-helix transcriptional regulator [Actinomadura atramentaria]
MTNHSDPAPRIEPRLAGYTGYLALPATQRATGLGMDSVPPGRHPRDLAVLLLLADAGPLSQARAGEVLRLNRTIMVKIVDGLEDAGLVVRERDAADRRRNAVRITEAGRATMASMYEGMRRAEKVLTEPLTAAEHERLNRLLRLVIPDLAAALPEAVTGRTGFLLARVHRRLRDESDDALRGLGLEPRHLGVLAALERAQPCSQQRLAGCMGVSGPAVVRSIDELDAAGLLRRERSATDRREHVLEMTPLGAARFADALGALDDVQRSLAERVGKEELAELNGLLVALTGARPAGD